MSPRFASPLGLVKSGSAGAWLLCLKPTFSMNSIVDCAASAWDSIAAFSGAPMRWENGICASSSTARVIASPLLDRCFGLAGGDRHGAHEHHRAAEHHDPSGDVRRQVLHGFLRFVLGG